MKDRGKKEIKWREISKERKALVIGISISIILLVIYALYSLGPVSLSEFYSFRSVLVIFFLNPFFYVFVCLIITFIVLEYHNKI